MSLGINLPTSMDSGTRGARQLLIVAIAVAEVVGTIAAWKAGGSWSAAARWLLYVMATGSVAALLGLVFGVPRARTDFKADTSAQYGSNSNLEEISDWLTKLLVGAGLVELGHIPHHLSRIGAFLGQDLDVKNPNAFALTGVVYGFGVGFGGAYLWVRLRLRTLFEAGDREAVAASRDRLATHLRKASTEPGSETDAEVYGAVDKALAATEASPTKVLRRVLWVDDYPNNNSDIVEALKDLGIRTEQVVSTADALARLQNGDYGVLITDLGRKEGKTDNDMAGRDLIQQVRAAGMTIPIIVYAGRRGLMHRDELIQAGAALVTNRASDVFGTTVTLLTQG